MQNLLSYRVQNLNVTAGFVDKEIRIPGAAVFYHSPTNGPDIACKLNSLDNDSFLLRPKSRFTFPFESFFVTLTTPVVGVDAIQLIIGKPKDVFFESGDVVIDEITTVLELEKLKVAPTLNHAEVTVDDTADLIRPLNADRKSCRLFNTGLDTVYIGGTAGVTSSNGWPVLAGDQLFLEFFTGTIYGVCDTGNTTSVIYLEESA